MLGKTLGGRYHIVKHLGGGGFGQTYLASDRQLPGNPLCVVKLLSPKAANADTLAIARRLFDRESQVLYRLGKHEQIPNLLAHFEEDKEFYLVQEFIEGEELKAELPLGKQLSEAKVIAILLGILKILEFVHQQEVIHRDIKPSNLIRRQQDGKIFLIDFGAVKEVSATEAKFPGQTTLTVAIGSPGYMPNEQLSGNPKFCSDIYAVGMIGIQALTGIPANGLPVESETSELMWRDRANVSKQLADVLDKMVRYDYRQRYQTATQTLQALQLVNSQQSTQAYSTPTHKLTPLVDNLKKPISPSTQPLQTSPPIEETTINIAGLPQSNNTPAPTASLFYAYCRTPILGNITKDLGVDAIVNSCNRSLSNFGAISSAIHNAAGPELLEECQRLGSCEKGDAKITRGYKLPTPWVIHTVCSPWRDGSNGEEQVLAQCYRRCLELAVQHSLQSIAFPAIGTGAMGFPASLAAEIAFRETSRFLLRSSTLETILFVCSDLDTHQSFKNSF